MSEEEPLHSELDRETGGETEVTEEESASEDSSLDEEDLELIQENMGVQYKQSKHFRRIKRRIEDESEEEVMPIRKERKTLEDIFDESEEEEEAEPTEEENLSDFIESDHDEREYKKPATRKPAALQRKLAKGQGVSTDVMQEMLDIFGDGYDYSFEESAKGEPGPPSAEEPNLMIEALFATEDDKIRFTDVPERYQVAPVHREISEEPVTSIEDDLRAESVWVATKLSQTEPPPENLRDDMLLKRLNARAANRKQFLSSVAAIIKWVGHDGFEVPFVASNRKEHYVDFLDLADLWTIYELDQQWQKSQKYRRRLLQNLRGIKNAVAAEYSQSIAELISRLDDRGISPQEEDIMDVCYDVEDYLSGHPQILGSIKDQKLPNFNLRPDLVSDGNGVHQSMLLDFIKFIGITPKSYGRNLCDRVKIMEPEDHELSPETVSASWVSKVYPTALSVIDKALKDMALEFSLDLNVRRGLRGFGFFDLSVLQTQPPTFLGSDMVYVSVQPTESGQKKFSGLTVPAVISASPDQLLLSLARVHYLKDKPLNAVTAEEAALLFHGEQNNLIDVRLNFILRPEAMKELEGLISSERYSPNAEEWNPLRCQMLKACLDHFLFPRLLSRLKDQWKQMTCRIVGSWMEMNLMNRLISAPPSSIPPESVSEDPIHIIAISNGQGGRAPTVAVSIDKEGRCLKYQIYHQLGHVHPSERMYSEDFQLLARFIHESNPRLVVVSGWGQNTRNLYNDISRFVQELKEGSFVLRPLSQDARTDIEETKLLSYLRVAYQKDDLARIYMATEKGKEEAAIYNIGEALAPLFLYCLSLARRAMDPCVEWAYVLTDAQSELDDSLIKQIVDLNPRQGMLSFQTKEFLIRSFVNVVNLLGVDFHRALNSPWYFSLLPFVAGLGPKKALYIKSRILQQNFRVFKRNDLLVLRLMGRRVFLNVASFIRITEEYLPQYHYRRKQDHEQMDILDSTRIHPENYQLARKMAADALDRDVGRYDDDSRLILELMKVPEKLQSLLLEEYAHELEKKLNVQKGITLLDLKAELLAPYHDVRLDVSHSFEEPSADELFYMLIGISKSKFYHDVYPGAILSGQVFKVTPKSALIKLDAIPRVMGSVFIRNIADAYVDNVEDRLHVNQRIPYLKVIGVQKEKFLIELTMRVTELFPRGLPQQPNVPPPVDTFDMLSREEKRAYVDSYFDFESEEVFFRAEKSKQDKAIKAQIAISGGMTPSIGNLARPSLPQRNIPHRLFKNFNRVQAEHFLSKMHDGDIVVRPSSRGLSYIVFSWRLVLGVYCHLDVKEDAKDTPYSLGKRLFVDQEPFEDLDEIITRVVQPMLEYSQLIIHHPKYVDVQTESEVDVLLSRSHKEDTRRIHYYLSISRDFPGRFILSWMPSSKTYHELITVTAHGYKFKSRKYDSINDLINSFKQDFMKRTSQTAIAEPQKGAAPVQNIIRTR